MMKDWFAVERVSVLGRRAQASNASLSWPEPWCWEEDSYRILSQLCMERLWNATAPKNKRGIVIEDFVEHFRWRKLVNY